MIAKIALALAGLSFAVPAVPQAVHNNPMVKQVRCDKGSGSAFLVGPHTLFSVAHVTTLGGCMIDGKPIAIAWSDGAKDLSIIHISATAKQWLKIDCSGYRAGQIYYGVGHALGLEQQTTLPVMGTGEHDSIRLFAKPIAILVGNRFIPGMSGGVVLNAAGEAVGTVNAYSPIYQISFSRELRDSPLCPDE